MHDLQLYCMELNLCHILNVCLVAVRNRDFTTLF